MRKSLGVAGGLAAILASCALVFAPSAMASFVLYQSTNLNGYHATFNSSDAELNNRYWDGQTTLAQNGGSSMNNNTGSYVGMWDIGGSCTGISYTAAPNSHDLTFSNNNFDNKASCVLFL